MRGQVCGYPNKVYPNVSSANQVKSPGSGAAVQLTEAQKASLQAKARKGLLRALVAQAIMALVAVAICWLVAGVYAGASALLGAAAYLVPNALFALRLLVGLVMGRPANPAGFLLGELIKLGAAVALLVLGVYLAQAWLVWPALIFGLVMVLKGYVLLLMFSKLP